MARQRSCIAPMKGSQQITTYRSAQHLRGIAPYHRRPADVRGLARDLDAKMCGGRKQTMELQSRHIPLVAATLLARPRCRGSEGLRPS
ncbi:jg26635 [Pararge aegeria aegeria]|uniref:Jg26635 protein n=1 Tax=Pararge aegeria aegeria TaxID=348720 RepID=A0A8S4QYA5_9NEOP|nr:jg26635 [Pararge aegeria aegeria]